MNRQQGKKRGKYKKYLNPEGVFRLPKSTRAADRQMSRQKNNEALSGEAPADARSSDCSSDRFEDAGELRTTATNVAATETCVDACYDHSSQMDWDDHQGPEEEMPVGTTEPCHSAVDTSPSDVEPQDCLDLLTAEVQPDVLTPSGASAPDSACEKPVLGELFEEIVSETVVVSKGDMLLMVLKHALKKNLSLTALTSLMYMINSFLSSQFYLARSICWENYFTAQARP